MENLLIADKLKKGDKVAIVSLSGGMLGEPFCLHSLEIGKKRLEEFGLVPIFMPNSLKGIAYLKEHPEKRAEDLKLAFSNPEIKAIICAIGGNDTCLTVPYLMDDVEFVDLVRNNPKIFTGFSDSTINHLMFYRIGLQTFYGPNFLCDIADISNNMLKYTEDAFLSYFENFSNTREIYPSDVWYEERTDFSADAVGTDRICHMEKHGFELLQGPSEFEGKLWGGCIDSLYSLINSKNSYLFNIGQKYHLIPEKEHFGNKILFLETSDSKPSTAFLQSALLALKDCGIFDYINAIIFGKPQDEAYYEEYKSVLISVISNTKIPILYNVNFGHAYPRTTLPYGAFAKVYADQNKIVLE